MMYNQDKQIQDMLNEIEEKGISVYESEYGFGYTYCDADIYLTFEQALIAAYYLTTGK